MGGVDDNGPPLKRVKPASTELDNHSNNSFLSDPTIPLGGLMAKPLVSHGKNDTVGSKGIIKRVEFVRIITEALYSLGYARSGAILEEESGICLHSPVVSLFKQQVLDGNWDGSLATLHKIGLADENLMKSASFLILEKKFLELVENNKLVDALETLRNDISPLGINKKRVHELSGCLVYPSQFASSSFASSGTKAENPRLSLLVELQKLLPPTVLIPERRLENLVEQALNVQKETCSLHNSVENSFSLYSDHHCGKDQIPCQTTQILQDHCDEVWFLQFSNNGKYLASSSNDNSAIIWEVSEAGKVSLKHKLNGHKKPVLMVAWSPDDQQLLSCGVEEVICRWDVGSGQCLRVYEKSGFGLISCGWFPDGKRICSGATDKSICMWDLDGKEIDCWKGLRTTKTSDLAISRNGKWIISTCKEKTILLQDRDANLEKFIQEQQTITSFCLSRDDKFLLVNLINQEIHLWSIIDGPKLIAKYEGHKRSRFLIRSCFGGSEQSFIASGSEDSQVYIWHRETGELIWKLPGHGGAVNCGHSCSVVNVVWVPPEFGEAIACICADGTLSLWEEIGQDAQAVSWKLCKLFEGTGTQVLDVQFGVSLTTLKLVSNLLYVDQPTGTGFSYSSDKHDLCHDEKGVSNDLYDFLQEFFKEHKEYAMNDFYITGESYAGHYIPAFASRVHQGNKAEEGIHINLKGFAIGNGLTNPEIQYKAYTDYALEMGIIQESDYKKINKIYPACQHAIKLCGTSGKTACVSANYQ